MEKPTKKQQEVLTLLTQEFLTLKQIAIRRGVNTRAVEKIVKRLKDKGILNFKMDVFRGTPLPIKSFRLKTDTPLFPVETHQIRLHSQEFNIRILYKDARYKQNKANTLNIDGNTIRLYRNSIEIYSGHSFFADDVQTATSESFEYWNRLFTKLENDLNIILVKSRSQNIKLVKQHYSEINNELARDCINKSDKIKVYTREDNKVWFLIDNSFNLHEAETIHPETAKQDMEQVIKPFFDDLRFNKPPLLSEIWRVTASLTTLFSSNTNIYTNSIKALTEQINLHLEVMQNMNLTMSSIRNELKGFRKPYPDAYDVISGLFENPVKLAEFKALTEQEQNKILFGGENATR